MRQNSLGLPKIISVLIDTCDLPSNIRHLRYADFRGWEDASMFSVALSQVLEAVNLTRSVPTKNDLLIFIDHFAEFVEVCALAFQIAGLALWRPNQGGPPLGYKSREGRRSEDHGPKRSPGDAPAGTPEAPSRSAAGSLDPSARIAQGLTTARARAPRPNVDGNGDGKTDIGEVPYRKQ
jgi:hypothetical protein